MFSADIFSFWGVEGAVSGGGTTLDGAERYQGGLMPREARYRKIYSPAWHPLEAHGESKHEVFSGVQDSETFPK